jgi:hypothetical protein
MMVKKGAMNPLTALPSKKERGIKDALPGHRVVNLMYSREIIFDTNFFGTSK